MNLQQALRKLDARRRAQVMKKLAKLNKWAGGYQVLLNLRAETRLVPDAWSDVLGTLRSMRGSASALRPVISRSLRRWILHGAILKPPPITLGRAVTLDIFCRHLRERGYYASERAALHAVRRMLRKAPPLVAREWRDFDLGRYVMWATFDPSGMKRPFEHFPADADQIRALLGLSPNEKGLSLLLLEYSLPMMTTPRFPTLADAYAGTSWPYYFRPAPPGAAHGLTMPWEETLPPQPETVHEIVRGAQVTATPREAK
jgi:hypothetical protein